MSFSIGQTGFDYWIRLRYWTPVEATILISGEIPQYEVDFDQLVISPEMMLDWLGDEGERLKIMLDRQFEEKDLTPSALLAWAEKYQITVAEPLKEAASNVGIAFKGKTAPAIPKLDGRGSRSSDIREAVFGLLIKLILKNPINLDRFLKADGEPNADALADFVDDFKDSYSLLGKYGAGRENILKSLRRAFSNAK